MFNSIADRVDDILLEETHNEKVDIHTYLGQLSPINSNKETEIERKISLG